jgi:hypothetical protein
MRSGSRKRMASSRDACPTRQGADRAAAPSSRSTSIEERWNPFIDFKREVIRCHMIYCQHVVDRSCHFDGVGQSPGDAVTRKRIRSKCGIPNRAPSASMVWHKKPRVGANDAWTVDGLCIGAQSAHVVGVI